MQKISIIAGILIFILVTIIVLSADTTSDIKKVQFTNQNLVINNENTDISSENVKINLSKSKISNKEIQPNNKNIDLQSTNVKISSTDTSNQNINFENKEFSNKKTNYSNQNTSYNNQNTELNKQLQDYEKQKAKLNNIENKLHNQNTTAENENPPKRDRYLYKNIDWSTWKSDFVNKIIDDSMYIRSLNDYDVGTWFYYSFNVTSTGVIKDVKVMSPFLLAEDKEKIARLIRSYQYKDITVFPANSKRTTAKVDAVVLLGDTEKRANPSDFNDSEQVKIHLPY